MAFSRDELWSRREKIPPKRCGVYFLWSGDRLLYVGQSTDIVARIAGHYRRAARLELLISAFTCIPCDAHELDALERKYIQLFSPPLNSRMIWEREPQTR